MHSVFYLKPNSENEKDNKKGNLPKKKRKRTLKTAKQKRNLRKKSYKAKAKFTYNNK